MATKYHPDFEAAARAADQANGWELLALQLSDVVEVGGEHSAHVVAWMESRCNHWRNREAVALRGES